MLFTTPLVLTDSQAVDHSFNWMYQLPGTLSGFYTETAAPQATEAHIRTNHRNEKASMRRHLVSLAKRSPLNSPIGDDPVDAFVTVNVTVTHHAKHDVEYIDDVIDMTIDMLGSVTGAALIRQEI